MTAEPERVEDEGAGDGQGVVIPITGELDLHAFAAREIPSLVAEYLRACRERGILRVRLAHGRGRGVQRAVVRRVLRGSPDVVSFADAAPDCGGWGATVAELRAQARTEEDDR